MGLFDSISKLFVDPVDTSGATRAVNQSTDSALSRLQPNIDASNASRDRILDLLLNPNSFQGTPAFQFALDQGVQARDRSAAARGQLGSGNQLKELTTFGQGLANQERGNEINRFLSFLGQTNPANQSAASIDLGKGENLAGISLGAENARVNTSGSLLNAALGVGGSVLGSNNNLTRGLGLF